MEFQISREDIYPTVAILKIVLALKGMLRRNIEHFLKSRTYERLGFSEKMKREKQTVFVVER